MKIKTVIKFIFYETQVFTVLNEKTQFQDLAVIENKKDNHAIKRVD